MDRSFVAYNTTIRERLRALVNRISDDELARPLENGWTVAAVLAHVAFWDQRALALLKRWEREGVGPSPLPEDVDILNDAFLPFLLALPPREVARRVMETAEQLDEKLAALSPETLAKIEAAGEPFGLSRAHRGGHLDQIERARI